MNRTLQGATSATEDGPRGGGEQHPIIGGDLFRSHDKHPARLAEKRPGSDILEVGLESVTGVPRALIHDDEVQGEATGPWRSAPLYERADEGLVVCLGDSDQHDRKGTGDSVRPQGRLPQAV